MKYYLLIMGENYYPSGGTGDWKGTYESYQEAKDSFVETGCIYGAYQHKDGTKHDWYDIVDLREWIDEKA